MFSFTRIAIAWLIVTSCEAVSPTFSPVGKKSAALSSIFPLQIAPDGRYLVDNNGAPFPILGDAAWSAPHDLSPADQLTYLDDRIGRGFNAVLVETIEHKFTLNKPPLDLAGNLPFSKQLGGNAYSGSPDGITEDDGGANANFSADDYSDIDTQAPDFTYPVELYWSGIDAFITLCAQNGVVVFLFPAYVGYGGLDEGWMREMVANDVSGAGGFAAQAWADSGKTKLWNYGAWLADRYASFDNIIWVQGGDYGSGGNSGSFSTPEKTAVNDLFAGMKSVSGQRSVLHTAHWSRPSLASDVTLPAGTFDLESVYTNTAAAQSGLSGYAHTPVAPTFEIEDYYENNSSIDDSYGSLDRRFPWWLFLSNIAGFFFGNEDEWRFVSGWQDTLNSPASQDLARLNAFVKSVAWQSLLPSTSSGMRTLITDGGGVANPQSQDFVAAAATPDGSLLVAYFPPAHSGAVTVDLSVMAGTARARWFDPTNATYAALGNFANQSGATFSTPGANSAGDADWVLVVDSTSGAASSSSGGSSGGGSSGGVASTGSDSSSGGSATQTPAAATHSSSHGGCSATHHD